MLSKTKKPVELEVIKTLIFDSFGADTSIGKIMELTDGWFNAAYSIELLKGRSDMVLKVSYNIYRKRLEGLFGSKSRRNNQLGRKWAEKGN